MFVALVGRSPTYTRLTVVVDRDLIGLAPVVVGFTIFLVVFLIQVRAERLRERATTAAARSLGLLFSPVPPRGLAAAVPFTLYRSAIPRSLHDTRGEFAAFFEGVWQGMPVIAFDYTGPTGFDLDDGMTMEVGNAGRYTCAITRSPVLAPSLRIAHRGLFAGTLATVGAHGVEFESGDFNSAFDVRCTDRKFAWQVIDQRMMRWLLDERRWAYEMRGPYILCYTSRLKPAELSGLLKALKTFRELLPTVVVRSAAPATGTEPLPSVLVTPERPELDTWDLVRAMRLRSRVAAAKSPADRAAKKAELRNFLDERTPPEWRGIEPSPPQRAQATEPSRGEPD